MRYIVGWKSDQFCPSVVPPAGRAACARARAPARSKLLGRATVAACPRQGEADFGACARPGSPASTLRANRAQAAAAPSRSRPGCRWQTARCRRGGGGQQARQRDSRVERAVSSDFCALSISELAFMVRRVSRSVCLKWTGIGSCTDFLGLRLIIFTAALTLLCSRQACVALLNRLSADFHSPLGEEAKRTKRSAIGSQTIVRLRVLVSPR